MAAEAAVPQMKGFNIFQVASTQQFQRVQVHPLAVIAIVDAYARRMDGADRCIGTLLGYITDGNIIEITDAFTVAHKDEADGKVMMDQEYHRKMLRLKGKVCPKESIVGWFSTGDKILASSIVIHTFYESTTAEKGQQSALFNPTPALPKPLHMIVDTKCTNNKLTVKCFVNNVTPGIDSLVQFHEIPVTVAGGESEACLAVLPSPIPDGDADSKNRGFLEGIEMLIRKFKKVQEFTGRVVEGKEKVDAAASVRAREFSQVLNSAEPLSGESFEQLCSSTLQDTLMCVYLSNLARSQTALAEKINAFTATLDRDLDA